MKRILSLLMVAVLVVGMTMSMTAPAMAAEASTPYYLFGRGTLGNVRIIVYEFSNSDSTVRVRIGNSDFTCPVTHTPLGAPGASMTQSAIKCNFNRADVIFYTGLDESVNTKNGTVTFDICIIHETNAKVRTHILKASGSYEWRSRNKVTAPKDTTKTEIRTVGDNSYTCTISQLYSYQTRSRYSLEAKASGYDYTYKNNCPAHGIAQKSYYSIRVNVSVLDEYSVVKHDEIDLRAILNDGESYRYSVATLPSYDPYFNTARITAEGYTTRLSSIDYLSI